MSDQPLALLHQAERLLAEATDLNDLLDLRAMGKAAEAAAFALGLNEAAQRAKVFQLRAERKAGTVIAACIRGPGNPQWSPRATIGLDDLDITKAQSARWQEFAAIPEDKFVAYVDEHLAKGWEITGGGLRSYARALAGKSVQPRGPNHIYLKAPPGICALHGYKVPCAGPLTGQHILNKSKARGNEEVRAILASCPPEVMAAVCQHHNDSRTADEKEAQRILWLQKVYEFGYAHISDFLRSLPWKVAQPDLTLEAILG